MSEQVPEPGSVDEAFARICQGRHPGRVCTRRRFRDDCLRLLPKRWRDKL
ncbi:hypothetical protein [Actinopolymorpha pittospori]|uniref:Uncharacterized protein n=1 Tax=Actinopolymorpha pittospori TaxID=648752 RepID=A0A927N336_9ACTN|nr:hypothetical protein [Actinopolymorpha pittospori]MBE1608052.1 hypothetical protein [Actinopolymorpha pittospori]